MEWIFSRPFVVVLAIAGGVFSLAAMALRKRADAAPWPARLDTASYVLMGASMLLFIIAGLRGPQN